MVRTQIYLTAEERAELETLSQATGKSQSELIRSAVDLLIAQTGKHRRDAILKKAAGLWKDRTDLPDFRALRKQWDRT